ncbi:hypothetical protein HIM_02092 [Hirsutella minnesotensis 3608]|nr:hypothetical protein HIM_02092 [Hirsutella minnesotensis 3608]
MPSPPKASRLRPQAANQYEGIIARTNETARAFLGSRQPLWMQSGSITSSAPSRKTDVGVGSQTQTKHNVTEILPSPALSGTSSPDLSRPAPAPYPATERVVDGPVSLPRDSSDEGATPQGSILSPSDSSTAIQPVEDVSGIDRSPIQQPGRAVPSSNAQPSSHAYSSHASASPRAPKRTAFQAAYPSDSAGSSDANAAQDLDGQRKRQRGDDAPRASLPSAVPSGRAPPALDPQWRVAVEYRIRLNGAFESLNPSVEQRRYKLLHEACVLGDAFYVILHQLFCLWSVNEDLTCQFLKQPHHVVGPVFELLRQLLGNNSIFQADNLRWFASFPLRIQQFSRLISLQRLTEIRCQLAAFIRDFVGNWKPLMAHTAQRRYPVRACELIQLLKCTSPILQCTLFTSNRRMLGVGEGAIASELLRLHIEDRQNEARLGGNPNELISARSEMARRCAQLVFQASGTPPLSHHAPAPGHGHHSPASTHVHLQPPSSVLHVNSHRETSFDPSLARQTQLAAKSPPPWQISSNGQVVRVPSQAYNSPYLPNSPHATSMPGVTGSGCASSPLPMAYLQRQPMQQNLRVANPTVYRHATGQITDRRSIPPGPYLPMTSTRSFVQGQQLSVTAATALHSYPSGSVPVPMVHPITRSSGPFVSNGSSQQDEPRTLHEVLRLQEHELPRDGMQCIRNSLHLPFLHSPKRVPIRPCEQRLYQFVSRFAVPPTAFPPRKGLRKLHFLVSETEFPRIAKVNYSREGPTCACFSGSLRYRLRFCKQDHGVTDIGHTQWATSASFWPQHVFLDCNDQPLQPRRRQHFQHDLPIELGESVRLGGNTIQISLPEVAATVDDRCSYFVGVEIVVTLDHKAVRKMAEEQTHIGSSETRREVKRRLTPRDNEVVVIEADRISVSVSDPFSSSLFQTPVRGVDCRHLECFDLDTWLRTRPAKHSQRPGEPSLVDCWKCPICGLDARPASLRIDDFFAEVQQALVERGDTTTRRISIRSDGTWEAIEELGEKGSVPGHRYESRSQMTQARASDPTPEEIIILDE